jgi:hypothetical protein
MYQQVNVRHRTLASGIKPERVQRNSFERQHAHIGFACTSIDL